MSALLSDLLTSVVTDRAELQSALEDLSSVAGEAWSSQMQEAGEFVLRVVRLNPNRTIAEIMTQPDVQDALTTPFRQATLVTQGAIRDGWDRGSSLGMRAAVRNMSQMGYPIGSGVPGDQSLLKDVLDDADRNGKSAADRLLQIVRSNNPEKDLQKLIADLQRRAEYGANFALQKAYSEAEEASYALAMKRHGITLKKMWVTHFSPNTCITCASLHGTVRTLGETFPDGVQFGTGLPPKPYGLLNGPPRHPNCRCQLVPFMDSMGKGPGATPQKMSGLAMDWFTGEALDSELGLGWLKGEK